MKKSRLKNIVNISKSISNKSIGEFDYFKDSLPNQVRDSYRLEAAWKAYGKPKDFKEAVWYGMIQPTGDQEFRLPSIGYNEETDEYEYLNKGKDNETVNKDIRVWDNDVIPFVKELKNGGYIRTFNEEKDCWTYTKNKPQENQEVIDSYQKGGQTSYKESPEQLVELIKNSKANFAKRLLDPNRKVLDLGNGQIGTHKLSYATNDKGVVVYPEIQEINGELHDLSYDRETAYKSAMQSGDYVVFPSEESAEWFTADNYKRYFPGLKQYAPQSRKFKQGGAVIPSGSLHAHKNHMQLASDGLVTSKGIPVVSEENGKIQQQAEIEREEVIFDKQATTDIESLYKKFNETDKESEKNEIAIKAGKILTDIFIKNTDDRTGLIEKVAEKNNLEYNK